jgi:hypothetical protein
VELAVAGMPRKKKLFCFSSHGPHLSATIPKQYAHWALGEPVDGLRWWASVRWRFSLFSTSILFSFSFSIFFFGLLT